MHLKRFKRRMKEFAPNRKLLDSSCIDSTRTKSQEARPFVLVLDSCSSQALGNKYYLAKRSWFFMDVTVY